MSVEVAPILFQDGGSIYNTSGDFTFKVGAGLSPSLVFVDSVNAEQFRITNDYFNNLFIGKNAGSQNAYASTTVGAYNTFVGAESGKVNTTGYALTASGFGSLSKNTIGSRSTAYGYQALFWNTTGDNLTALGTDAGFRSGWKGTESFNTLLGSLAGQERTAGNNSVGVGYQALYQSNASQAVAVGNRAGLSAGTGGVYLGYRAGELETGNNKLYIHNNESSIPLIYGDFSSKIVRLSSYLQFEEVSLGTALNESVFVDTTDKDIKFKNINGVVSSLTGRVNIATEGLTATGNWTQNWDNNRLIFENISNLSISEATGIYGFDLESNSSIRKMVWKNTTSNRSIGINAVNAQDANFGAFDGSSFRAGIRAFISGSEYRTNLQLTNSLNAQGGMHVSYVSDGTDNYVKYSYPSSPPRTIATQGSAELISSETDHFIQLNGAGFAITASLPTVATTDDGREYIIKCIDATNACTAATTDGATTEWPLTAMALNQTYVVKLDKTNTAWRLIN